MHGASHTIRRAMLSLDGVRELPHRFGGIEFRLGKRELGHLHGDSLLDIPFPMSVRNELVENGEAEKHHIVPESGWISFSIRTSEDIAKAIGLLHRSFDIATESARQKQHTAIKM